MKNKTEKLEGLLKSLTNLRKETNLYADNLINQIQDVIRETNRETKMTRLAPFDITKAKQGAKVVTASGEDVRILCYDRRSAFEIVALIMHQDDEEEVILCTEYGHNQIGYDTDDDLRILE